MRRLGVLAGQIDAQDIGIVFVGVGLGFVDWRLGMVVAGCLLIGLWMFSVGRSK